MPRIFTPPDIDFDRSIPKFFIKNCPWTDEQLQQFIEQIDSTKLYDIYVYRDEMNDIQWAEGIRAQSVKTFDWKQYQTLDPIEWLRRIDDLVR